MEFKLGRKPGVVLDPRTFAMEALLTSLPTVPAKSEFSAEYEYPMFGNDHAGDCTFVTQGHRIIGQERNAAQKDYVNLTTEDILLGYADLTGYDPVSGERDNGAYTLDVLNYMHKTGIKTSSGEVHTIDGFAKVNHNNHDFVKVGCNLFGGLVIGARLPLALQDGLDHVLWDAPVGALTGPWKPGSWGGHEMYVSGYDEDGIIVRSWARRYIMSWRFLAVYVDECYVTISKDFMRTTEATRKGYSEEMLNALLKQLV